MSNQKIFPTKYKYVQRVTIKEHVFFRTRLPNHGSISFVTAREAAVAVDKMLINMGKSPINILKPTKTPDYE